MPSVKVQVQPSLINWVLHNVPDNQIDYKVIQQLEEWKVGNKLPTFRQIESVSKATNIPLGYFFLQNPPKEKFEILDYRTIDSISAINPSRNLIDTINSMESIQEWMRDYLISLENLKLSIIGSERNNDDPQRIANAIREFLEIPLNWATKEGDAREAFNRLRNKLSAVGILVMMSGIVGKNTHRPLDIEEFRAFTIIDEYAPLIFINANDSHGGRLFSLAHEMVHIWLGKNNFYNDRHGNQQVSKTEQICNAVAAEILVPANLFVEQWNFYRKQLDIKTTISKLASYFNCSETVIARRALDHQFISGEQYSEIARNAINSYLEFKKKASSGGDYYKTIATRVDKRFLIALDHSLSEGKTSYTDAYRLTNTSRKTFSSLVEKVRGNDL